MEYTNNYNLVKPAKSQKSWDTLLNDNFDKIDNEIKNTNDKIGILNKKTGGIISVDEFGAKGDGVTDDTHAFKNAIQEMKNKNIKYLIGGGKHYIISDTLDFLDIDRPVIIFKGSKNSKIEMITDNKPLIKAHNISIENVELHAKDDLTGSGLYGIQISQSTFNNGTNATMISLRDVVIRGFYIGIYSDIEMDGFKIDGAVIRDFRYRGIEFNQDNNITTAPTTAPTFKNLFMFSNKQYDAYIHIKGSWVLNFESAILDGMDSYNFTSKGRAIVFNDLPDNHSSRTRTAKISGVHMEDFKTAIETNLTNIQIENVRIQNTTTCVKRTSGNSLGGLVFTEIINSEMVARTGGKVFEKLESGGRGYLLAIGSIFKGDISLKTSTDPNGFSERVRFIHCVVNNDTTNYVPTNLTGESVVASDWIFKARHVQDASGGGFAGHKVTASNSATIVEYDLVDGTDTTKFPSYKFSANGEGLFEVNKLGFKHLKAFKIPFKSITSSQTINIFETSVYLVDASAGNITITLPFIDGTSGNSMIGIIIKIKRTDSSANTVTINRNGNTIDGNSSNITVNNGETVTLLATGGGKLVTL